VGAVIQLEKIPLSKQWLNYYDKEIDWAMVCNAGDDYELCFTCPPTDVDAMLSEFKSQDIEVFPIGEITNTSNVTCYLDDKIHLLSGSGYNHFSHDKNSDS